MTVNNSRPTSPVKQDNESGGSGVDNNADGEGSSPSDTPVTTSMLNSVLVFFFKDLLEQFKLLEQPPAHSASGGMLTGKLDSDVPPAPGGLSLSALNPSIAQQVLGVSATSHGLVPSVLNPTAPAFGQTPVGGALPAVPACHASQYAFQPQDLISFDSYGGQSGAIQSMPPVRFLASDFECV